MYNPYSITFPAAPASGDPSYLNKSGELFELLYKGARISDGRQPRQLAIQICDLLNSAFTNGVNDVKSQLDPVLAEYKTLLDEANGKLASLLNDHNVGPGSLSDVSESDDTKSDKTDNEQPQKARRVNKYIDVAD